MRLVECLTQEVLMQEIMGDVPVIAANDLDSVTV